MRHTAIGQIWENTTNEHLLHLNEGLTLLQLRKPTRSTRQRRNYVRVLLEERGIAFETIF
jgi:hypothetical protein